MNRLQNIIAQIDEEITSNLAFKDVKANGLVRREPKQGQTVIYKYNGSGGINVVGFDDVPGLNIYHRILGESDIVEVDSGFGNSLMREQTYSVRMIVFGSQTRVNDVCEDYNYELADLINGYIPSTFSSAILELIEARSITIGVTRVDYDRVSVFNTELPQNDFNLSEHNLLLAIEYDVTIRYRAECTTNTCDPVYPVVTIIDGEQTIEKRAPSSYTCSTVCDDAEAVLKNTAGTTLSTTDIPSGDSEDITAPDATANLRNTDGTSISSTDIASGASKDITAPNASAVLKNTAGTTLSTTNIPSNTSQDITAPNGTAVLKDTGGNTLSSTAIPSNVSQDITAPDGTVENTDSSYTDTVASGGTLVIPDINLDIEDQDGNPLFNGTNVAAVDISKTVTVPKTTQANFIYSAGTDTLTATIDIDSDETYTSAVLTNCSSPVYTLNASVVTLPFTVSDGDTLTVDITQTDTGQSSKVQLTGTYA